MAASPFIIVTLVTFSCLSFSSVSGTDFLFNSFKYVTSDELNLTGDARMNAGTGVISLTNDTKGSSLGRAFFATRLNMATINKTTGNTSRLSSFSTSFIFSILPVIDSSPGFGLAFVLSNTTSPPGANPGQYFGLFSNSTTENPGPLLAIEFDTGQNPEFNDPDGNHVGIDLNDVQSVLTQSAGYFRTPANGSTAELEFVPLDMRSGTNIRAWIEFHGPAFQINVTIAPAEMARPLKPLLSFTDSRIANYVSPEMFVGFSASKVTWVENQRILAWSFSDTGTAARELNTLNLPVFLPPPSPARSSLSAGRIAGVSVAVAVIALLFLPVLYYYYRRQRKRRKFVVAEGNNNEDEDLEEWEMKYWPRRFSYEDLWKATDGFSKERLLGHGGFGKVYRGVLGEASIGGEEKEEVAVKCVSHDSKQGLREFMAEISTVGRLQHKSLVPVRGWCRKGTELMLVYEYMANGSLCRWIFPANDGKQQQLLMGWAARRQVLLDVAEGLQYLHESWEQVVLHRDVKSGNILLDSSMRGRLGDFGLAKLYERGGTTCRTRVVGTLGYIAPELAHAATPNSASDVYGYGVVVLETVTGRRPIERAERVEEDDWLLIEWVRETYEEGKIGGAPDKRMRLNSPEKEDADLVLKLGLACCHPDPEQRPAMREVVRILLGSQHLTCM